MIPYMILASLREVASRAGFDGAYDRTFHDCSPGSRVLYCMCKRVVTLQSPIAFGFIGGGDVQAWRLGQCSGCGRIGCAGPVPPEAGEAAEVGEEKEGEWRG